MRLVDQVCNLQCDKNMLSPRRQANKGLGKLPPLPLCSILGTHIRLLSEGDS